MSPVSPSSATVTVEQLREHQDSGNLVWWSKGDAPAGMFTATLEKTGESFHVPHGFHDVFFNGKAAERQAKQRRFNEAAEAVQQSFL